MIRPNRSVSLSQTQRLHYVCPSADLPFESVAATYGNRAIVVILRGLSSDGSIAVKSVEEASGIVIAPNQATAEHFAMPKAAIDAGCVDHILPLEPIAPTLVSLVNQRHSQ